MFTSAVTPRRLKCIQPLAYYVARNNGTEAITFRMTRALAYSSGFKSGDAIRIDIGSGSDAGTVRLTKVAHSSRHWYSKPGSNQSLYCNATWSGDIEQAFPLTRKITGLEVLNISQDDGITCKLISAE